MTVCLVVNHYCMGNRWYDHALTHTISTLHMSKGTVPMPNACYDNPVAVETYVNGLLLAKRDNIIIMIVFLEFHKIIKCL